MDVYLRHSILPVDEDQTHELKGHRCISQDEVNPRYFHKDREGKNRFTRQCISKYLCGMLNSGKGGTIYCGILDDGNVQGFMLSPYQRDHVMLSIKDTFNRYNPKVPSHMYSVRFVRVVDDKREKLERTKKSTDNPEINPELAHVLRTHRRCWCDDEAMAMLARGLLGEFFVIEITVHPWNPSDPRNKQFIHNKQYPELNPVFMSEDGKGYLRRHASNECFEGGVDQVEKITREQMAAMNLGDA